MSGPVSRSRPDQVEALTRGVHLPLPPVAREHIEVILETLQVIFDSLAVDHELTLGRGDEPEINALMQGRLNALLLAPGQDADDDEPAIGVLWRQLVAAVARGNESVSFDGVHIEKRPDINVFLTFRHRSFPLVIECKIIDRPNGKTPRMYCEDGLQKFLRGEYGWGGREALMLGYVRDDSSLASSLAPLLTMSGGNPYAVNQVLQSTTLPPPDIANSVHDREFRYLGRAAPDDDPGSITIWHLWMPVLRPLGVT
ncbi:MAG: hypothetical protein ABSE20_25105 [Acetobacteraceae bacterium]